MHLIALIKKKQIIQVCNNYSISGKLVYYFTNTCIIPNNEIISDDYFPRASLHYCGKILYPFHSTWTKKNPIISFAIFFLSVIVHFANYMRNIFALIPSALAYIHVSICTWLRKADGSNHFLDKLNIICWRSRAFDCRK